LEHKLGKKSHEIKICKHFNTAWSRAATP